jgi:hypothetical protein
MEKHGESIMKSKFALSGALFGLVWLTGCGSAEPTLLPTDPQEPIGETPQGAGSPAPGGGEVADGERGPVYIDETELVVLESFPVQIEIVVRGALPTPCASLKWSVEAPDDQGRIMVEAYSLQDPTLACIEVLEQIEERLQIGSYSQGSYSVWLNGEVVGEFDV